MSEGAPDTAKRRNQRIAALGGSFVLPFAGLVGAIVLLLQDDREMAMNALAGAVLGAVAWILLLTA